MLTLQFGDNLLEETNNFQLVIEDESDLAGLTEAVIAGGAEARVKSASPSLGYYRSPSGLSYRHATLGIMACRSTPSLAALGLGLFQ